MTCRPASALDGGASPGLAAAARGGLRPSTARARPSSRAASLGLATPRGHPARVSGATVGKLFGTGSPSSGADALRRSRHVKYDKLRLREWFNAMDVDRSGHVTRHVFLRFLIDNPALFDVVGSIYASRHEEEPDSCATSRAGSKDTVAGAGPDPDRENRPSTPQEKSVDQAKRYRRLIAAWKEVDADKSGTLEWEEFVEYFRVNGFLLEYKLEDNPKDRMTDLLAAMHGNPGRLDAREMEEFSALRVQHVDSRRSYNLGVVEASNILNTMAPAETQDPNNPGFVRWKSSLSKVAAGPGSRRRPSSTTRPAARDLQRFGDTRRVATV